jgi:hypothetical protein
MAAALTFPLDLATFADTLSITAGAFLLNKKVNISEMGSGVPLKSKNGADTWETEVNMVWATHVDSSAVEGLLDVLGDPGASFYLYDPRLVLPKADPDAGVSLAAASPVVDSVKPDNIRITISGLPANYKISRGDMLAIDYGSPSRRALHRCISTVTADGTGLTGAIELQPHVQAGTAAGDTVTLIKAAAEMVLVGKMPQPRAKSSLFSQVSFKARQKL